ncbi:hypothetical protein SY88_03545 [Clostridiales bacterium PH28_bin88]|nr:hypothetical protein SY88_03545 [Clostridiales bacterium PH28_bin88]
MAIAIISTLQYSLDLLKEHTSQSQELPGRLPVIRGKFQGEEVILVDFSRPESKVDQLLKHLLEQAEISRVVFLGCGDACSEHLRPGDLVLGGEAITWEGGPAQTAQADRRMVDLCLGALEKAREDWGIRVLVGRVFPGPVIPDDLKTDISCVDAVAASVGEACSSLNLPFVLLCIIHPGGGTQAAMELFRRESGTKAFWAVKGLFEGIKEQQREI